jgi:preprotein translocase subunit YajC
MNLLSVLMAEGGGMGINVVMFLLIIVVFYFFMIRPQMKKQKEGKKFMDSLEKGQRIVTIGGVHGKIEEVRETTVIIGVEGGGKLKLEKRAISPDSNTFIGSDK